MSKHNRDRRERRATEAHAIKTSARTGSLQVIEQPDRIVLRLRFDRYGELGDDAEIQRWMRPILERYESDPRPIVMDHPLTGQVATIQGDRDRANCVIATSEPPEPPAEHNYIRKVLEFQARHNLPPGRPHEIGVCHDDWCGIHQGGRCDCDPDIKFLTCRPGSPETN